RHGSLPQDHRLIIALQPGNDGLAEPAGADQAADRGSPDVNNCSRFYPGQNGSRGQRQFDPPQPRPRRKTERVRPFLKILRDVTDSCIGIANDGQQAVEEKSSYGWQLAKTE